MSASRSHSVEEPDPTGEPFAQLFVFDHPNVGRALRSTFEEKRLGRAVFLNVLLLMVVFVIVQQAFTLGRLSLSSQDISFARAAFVAFAAIEVGVLSLFVPISFMGLFFTERKEQCFDQVVATGVRPHVLLFGRFVTALAFFSILIFSALPFFLLTVVMKGADLGMVLRLYAVLLGFMVMVASVTLFCCVSVDDTLLPALIGGLSLLVFVVAAFSPRLSPSFVAISPLRHVTVESAALMKALGFGALQGPRLFGYALPGALFSLAVYAFAACSSWLYLLIGPDFELTPGMNSFDTVAAGRNGELLRGHRLLTSTLLRTVQMRFLYENTPPLVKRLTPLLRLTSAVVLVVVVQAFFAAATWPANPPTRLGPAERRWIYQYLAFSGFGAVLLGFLGAQARAQLFDERPLLTFGAWRVSRVWALPSTFLAGLIAPVVIVLGAGAWQGVPEAILTASQAPEVYGIVALYASFVFGVAVCWGFKSTNPYTASGQTLLTLMVFNMIPVVWLIIFYFNGLGQSVGWILDISPFVTLFVLLRPDIPIELVHGDGASKLIYEHASNPAIYTWVYVALTALSALTSVVLAWRLARGWRDIRRDRDALRSRLCSPRAGALTLIALFAVSPGTVEAQAPAAAGEEEERFEVNMRLGLGGALPREGFIPLQLSVRNTGEALDSARVTLSRASGEPIRTYTVDLPRDEAIALRHLVPAEALSTPLLQLRLEDRSGLVLEERGLRTAALSQGPLLLLIGERRSAPFDVAKMGFSDLGRRTKAKRRGARATPEGPRCGSGVLTAAEAPSSALAYRGLRAVILGDVERGLDRARADALASYVARGGELIISVGEQARALRQGPLGEAFGPALAALADAPARRDVHIGAVRPRHAIDGSVKVPALAVLRPQTAEELWCVSESGEPLVTRARFGGGAVTLLAFDLWQPPFLHSLGARRLLEALLARPRSLTTRSGLLFPVVSSFQVSQARIAPAFGGLLLYCLLAGPVLYFVLRRGQRGLLAWLGVPLIIVLFSLMTPLYSLVLEGSDSAYFGATIYERFAGEGPSLVTSDLLLSSGGKESHSIKLTRPGLEAFSVVPRGRRRPRPMPEALFAGREPGREALVLDRIGVAMWGSRYLSFESRGADPVRISGRLRLLEREVELELRNDGAFSLTDLRIFYPIPGALDKDFGHVEVPALAIGERRTLRAPLALSTSDTPMEPYDQLVMGLLRSDYQQRLRREQRAWVFAKVGARSHGRGIETDARLRRAAWLSVAGAPLEIDYGSRVPYGALVAYRRGGTPITTFSFALPKRYFEGGESAIERLLVRFEGRRDAELSVQAPRQGKAGRWVSMKEKAPQAAEVDGGGAFREFVLTDPAEYLEPLTGSLRFRAVVRSSARGLPRSESRLEVQVVFRR